MAEDLAGNAARMDAISAGQIDDDDDQLDGVASVDADFDVDASGGLSSQSIQIDARRLLGEAVAGLFGSQDAIENQGRVP